MFPSEIVFFEEHKIRKKVTSIHVGTYDVKTFILFIRTKVKV